MYMSKNKPLISCVVPVYNVEKYLERCINSILNQTYTNYEIVIVNDGSTDRCEEILKKYSTLQNIIVFSQTNQGLSAARNQGIGLANGKYITFIDSDDWIDERFLEIMVSKIEKYNPDIISVDYLVCNGNQFTTHKNETVKVYYGKKCGDSLFSIDENNYAWGKLIKKSRLDENFFPIGKRYEDIGSMYKLYDKCNTVIKIEGKYYFYFQNENSITCDRRIQDVQNRIEYIEEMNVYNTQKEYEYWGFYRLVKAFGALADLYKIPQLEKNDRRMYIKKIYSLISECKIPLFKIRLDENWVRVFMMRMHVAHIFLGLKYL